MENIQNLPKKDPRGGPRPNSGRPKGSTNKLSGSSILEEIQLQSNGIPYETILVNDFLQARYNNDSQLVLKYHQMILNKVIADKVDITSNGAPLAAPVLTFRKEELPEYQAVEFKTLND